MLSPESLLSTSILAKVTSSTLNATVLILLLPLNVIAYTYSFPSKAKAILESESE